MESVETTLDITSDTCPMTFVRTKLALERMRPGDMLRIRLTAGEPLHNVPRSVVDHGHEIISQTRVDEAIFELVVQRGSD